MGYSNVQKIALKEPSTNKWHFSFGCGGDRNPSGGESSSSAGLSPSIIGCYCCRCARWIRFNVIYELFLFLKTAMYVALNEIYVAQKTRGRLDDRTDEILKERVFVCVRERMSENKTFWKG